MAAPEIQISKDGLKLSYQRYLEDSSTGFVAILCIIFIISNKYPIPFLGHSLESIIILDKNIQLFSFIIIFLSAAPIGVLINAVSWFFFSWQRSYLINFWFSLPEKVYNPFLPSKKNFYFNDLVRFFKINEHHEVTGSNIYEIAQYYEDSLSLLFPEKNRIEHVRGLIVFSRNLSFFTFVSILSVSHVMIMDDSIKFSISPIIFTVFITLLFMSVCSLFESHLCLKTLSTIYILCESQNISNEDAETPQKLIRKIYTAYLGDQSSAES